MTSAKKISWPVYCCRLNRTFLRVCDNIDILSALQEDGVMNSSLVGGLVALAGMQTSLFSFITHGEQKTLTQRHMIE